MIQILIKKDAACHYLGFYLRGHAQYGEYGQDIVCSAVSVLVFNTIHSIEQFTADSFELQKNKKKGIIKCVFHDSVSHETELLLDSMVLGLKQIENQYGKQYIRLAESFDGT